MMQGIKFDLYGKYAFFKNPEANLGTEFSFEHIHKPVILGILGAILGLKGKEQIKYPNIKILPEYYVKLKDIQISIVPSQPIFIKYCETITNSTGFANENSTQIIKKKILQDVQWTIYLLQGQIDKGLWEQLIELLKNHESKYPIYLGNNNYKAKIKNVCDIQLTNETVKYNEILINSIFPRIIMEENYQYCENDDIEPYELTIFNPKELNKYNLYDYEWYEYTNCLLDVDKKNIDKIYNYNGQNLYFL